MQLWNTIVVYGILRWVMCLICIVWKSVCGCNLNTHLSGSNHCWTQWNLLRSTVFQLFHTSLERWFQKVVFGDYFSPIAFIVWLPISSPGPIQGVASTKPKWPSAWILFLISDPVSWCGGQDSDMRQDILCGSTPFMELPPDTTNTTNLHISCFQMIGEITPSLYSFHFMLKMYFIWPLTFQIYAF